MLIAEGAIGIQRETGGIRRRSTKTDATSRDTANVLGIRVVVLDGTVAAVQYHRRTALCHSNAVVIGDRCQIRGVNDNGGGIHGTLCPTGSVVSIVIDGDGQRHVGHVIECRRVEHAAARNEGQQHISGAGNRRVVRSCAGRCHTRRCSEIDHTAIRLEAQGNGIGAGVDVRERDFCQRRRCIQQHHELRGRVDRRRVVDLRRRDGGPEDVMEKWNGQVRLTEQLLVERGLHQQVGRGGSAETRHAGATLVGIGAVHAQKAACHSRKAAEVEGHCSVDREVRPDRRTQSLGQTERRDADPRIGSAHGREAGSRIVGDQHAYGTGSLRIRHLHGEVAGATINQGDVAVHRPDIGDGFAAVINAGATGVDRRHDIACQSGVRHRRTKARNLHVVVAGNAAW